MEIKECTLLSDKQVFGTNKLETITKTKNQCSITDLAIALGASVCEEHLEHDKSP